MDRRSSSRCARSAGLRTTVIALALVLVSAASLGAGSGAGVQASQPAPDENRFRTLSRSLPAPYNSALTGGPTRDFPGGHAENRTRVSPTRRVYNTTIRRPDSFSDWDVMPL